MMVASRGGVGRLNEAERRFVTKKCERHRGRIPVVLRRQLCNPPQKRIGALTLEGIRKGKAAVAS